MGSPAQPVFKSSGSEKPAGPKQEKAKLMFQTWPLVQPAIAFGISTLSTYITAVIALSAVALYGGALQVHHYISQPGLPWSLDRLNCFGCPPFRKAPALNLCWLSCSNLTPLHDSSACSASSQN